MWCRRGMWGQAAMACRLELRASWLKSRSWAGESSHTSCPRSRISSLDTSAMLRPWIKHKVRSTHALQKRNALCFSTTIEKGSLFTLARQRSDRLVSAGRDRDPGARELRLALLILVRKVAHTESGRLRIFLALSDWSECQSSRTGVREAGEGGREK